jgi:hypothetical protein
MSAADSGDDVRGLWLNSADTGQWCHLVGDGRKPV